MSFKVRNSLIRACCNTFVQLSFSKDPTYGLAGNYSAKIRGRFSSLDFHAAETIFICLNGLRYFMSAIMKRSDEQKSRRCYQVSALKDWSFLVLLLNVKEMKY